MKKLCSYCCWLWRRSCRRVSSRAAETPKRPQSRACQYRATRRPDRRNPPAPAAKDAFWGIEIRDLKADKILYSQNADHFFVPASNTKLFTTALALTRLGPATASTLA